MQSRTRIPWRLDTRCHGQSPTARWQPVGWHQPAVRRRSVRRNGLAPQKPNGLLEGFCPEPRPEEQIAVNSNGLMLFLPLADIEWVEAVEHGVELHVGPETHRLGDTLAALEAKLPPDRFLRISPSALVNLAQIKQLQPRCRGECDVLLRNGMRLPYRD